MDERKTIEQREDVGVGLPAGGSAQAEERDGMAESGSRHRKIYRKQRGSIRRLRRGGVFWKGVEYANIMEQLDGYIGRFEGLKKRLRFLDKESLPDGVAMMHTFMDGEWLDIVTTLAEMRQIKKFQHMFDTVNVVLMLQCFHILDQRAKELGVDAP